MPDATQPGVSDAPKIHPRMAAMAAISNNNLEARAEEMGVDVDTLRLPAESTELTDDEKEAKRVADEEAARAAAEAATNSQTGEVLGTISSADSETVLSEDQYSKTMVTLKVDGKDTQVPLSKLIPQFQKGEAVEVRLERANAALAEAKRMEEEAAKKLAEANTASEKRAAETNLQNASQTLVNLQEQLFTAIATGDTEAGAKVFGEAVKQAVEEELKGRSTATPDPTKLVGEITAQVTQQITQQSALTQFQKDYGYLVADEDLFDATKRRAHKYQEEGKPLAESLALAGEEVSKKFSLGKYKPRPTQTGETTHREDKLKAKEKLETPVTGANVSAAGVTQAPLTNSERIAQMAAARPGSR